MTKDKAQYFPILDGVRGFAALFVCFAHFMQVDEQAMYENKILGSFIFKISELGLSGVHLFFVLSGFLITKILLDNRKSEKYFISFYGRRMLRIFPLYYFTLIVSLLIFPLFVEVDAPGKEILDNQVWLWTYLMNAVESVWDISSVLPMFGHYWSLCVEEHFYLFWPFLIYFIPNKYLKKTFLFVIGLSLFSLFGSYLISNSIWIFTWTTIRYIGALAIGGIISLYFSEQKLTKLVRVSNWGIYVFGILSIGILFLPRYMNLADMGFWCTVFFYAFLVVKCINNEKTVSKVFQNKSLIFLGKISYGLYVYHGLLRPFFKTLLKEPIFNLFGNAIISSIIYFIVCTAITTGIAYISWILMEQPILRLKKKFHY